MTRRRPWQGSLWEMNGHRFFFPCFFSNFSIFCVVVLCFLCEFSVCDMCRWKRGVKAALNTTKTTSNTSTWRTLFRCLCSCFCLFVETKIRWLSGNYHHLEAETLPSNSFAPGSLYHMSTYSLSDLEALRSDLFESERLSMTFHTWAGYGWIANCFRW